MDAPGAKGTAPTVDTGPSRAASVHIVERLRTTWAIGMASTPDHYAGPCLGARKARWAPRIARVPSLPPNAAAFYRGEFSVPSSRSKGLAGITVAALASAALVAGPASAADSVIYACIDKKTGDARLVTSKGVPLTSSTVCDPSEYATKIFWNQTGPQGAPGATGAT